jgi:hypothetical protein
MSITIPVWIFWILGGVVGLVVLGLAALGVILLVALSGVGSSMGRM